LCRHCMKALIKTVPNKNVMTKQPRAYKVNSEKMLFSFIVFIVVYFIPIVYCAFHPATIKQIAPILLLPLAPLIFIFLKGNSQKTKHPMCRKNSLSLAGKLLVIQIIFLAVANQLGSLSFQHSGETFLWHQETSLWWLCIWALYLGVASIIHRSPRQHLLAQLPNTKNSYTSLLIKRAFAIIFTSNAICCLYLYATAILINCCSNILTYFHIPILRDNISAYLLYSVMIFAFADPKLVKLYLFCKKIKLNFSLYLLAIAACLITLICTVSIVSNKLGIATHSWLPLPLWTTQHNPSFIFTYLAGLTLFVAPLLARLFEKTSLKLMIGAGLGCPALLWFYCYLFGAVELPIWLNWLGLAGLLFFVGHSRSKNLLYRGILDVDTTLISRAQNNKKIYQIMLNFIVLLSIIVLVGSINLALLSTFIFGIVSILLLSILLFITASRQIKKQTT
jgi:hypothetical protein